MRGFSRGSNRSPCISTTIPEQRGVSSEVGLLGPRHEVLPDPKNLLIFNCHVDAIVTLQKIHLITRRVTHLKASRTSSEPRQLPTFAELKHAASVCILLGGMPFAMESRFDETETSHMILGFGSRGDRRVLNNEIFSWEGKYFKLPPLAKSSSSPLQNPIPRSGARCAPDWRRVVKTNLMVVLNSAGIRLALPGVVLEDVPCSVPEEAALPPEFRLPIDSEIKARQLWRQQFST